MRVAAGVYLSKKQVQALRVKACDDARLLTFPNDRARPEATRVPHMSRMGHDACRNKAVLRCDRMQTLFPVFIGLLVAIGIAI